MAGLKELRTRIESIKSTQKITSAMKLVAAARLRRAQGVIEKSQTYHSVLLNTADRIMQAIRDYDERTIDDVLYPKLYRGTGRTDRHVVLVMSSNKGLCGGYNAKVAKEASVYIDKLVAQGKTVKIVCVGRKAADILKRKYADMIMEVKVDIVKKGARYDDASDLANKLMESFLKKEFDFCDTIYTKFNSAISTDVVIEQLLPVNFKENLDVEEVTDENCVYEFEPNPLKVLSEMLPLLVREELFATVAQSQASEHGLRMSSMDNATRNAKDIISKLTLRYNRIRQTAITTELIEIIAGAEAL